MLLSLIAAIANNRIIGLNNTMPWHLPADLEWFKQNTLNKAIIMGRKTYDSIGRPLPKRVNIVISRQPQHNDDRVHWCSSLEDAITLAKKLVKDSNEIMVIGGGNIYQQALPLADKLYLTYINADLQGDTQFPAYEPRKWNTLFEETHVSDEDNAYNYTFTILERKK